MEISPLKFPVIFFLIFCSLSIGVNGLAQVKKSKKEKDPPKKVEPLQKMELILRGKDDIELVRFIRDRIIEKTKERKQSEMKSYKDGYQWEERERGKVIKRNRDFEMIALKGGSFMMGTSSKDKSIRSDEKPAHKAAVSPFWIGKYETTWGLYDPFMITADARGGDGELEYTSEETEFMDVITSPTTPYMEMDFGMGSESDHPAISMTQHAANKFCEWLSYRTGHFYRLPTEAEWEYACRAGTTGDYSCPTEKLEEYAVIDPTQTRVGYERVGTKKPNPWGIYDMHGNVMEWCLDQYDAVLYELREYGNVKDPFILPNRLYPRVVRGGSWYDPAEECRSTTRYFSRPDWKTSDPELPQSLWYHTDAQWLGFRIVRPLKIPSAEEMYFYWNCAGPAILEKGKSQRKENPFER